MQLSPTSVCLAVVPNSASARAFSYGARRPGTLFCNQFPCYMCLWLSNLTCNSVERKAAEMQAHSSCRILLDVNKIVVRLSCVGLYCIALSSGANILFCLLPVACCLRHHSQQTLFHADSARFTAELWLVF